MDLVGSGRRLSSAELLTAANKFGVDVATLRAILQVETAGAGFDAKKRTRPVVSRGMIGMHRPHPREDRAGCGLSRRIGARRSPARTRRHRACPRASLRKGSRCSRGTAAHRRCSCGRLPSRRRKRPSTPHPARHVEVPHRPFESNQMAAVVAHHALGSPGGARCVEDIERVGGCDRDTVD